MSVMTQHPIYKPYRRARSPLSGCCPTCGSKLDNPLQLMLAEGDCSATRGEIKVTLEPVEFKILRQILDAFPGGVPVEVIEETVWGKDRPPAMCRTDRPQNFIQVYVSKLRRKIEPLGIWIPNARRHDGLYMAQASPDLMLPQVREKVRPPSMDLGAATRPGMNGVSSPLPSLAELFRQQSLIMEQIKLAYSLECAGRFGSDQPHRNTNGEHP